MFALGSSGKKSSNLYLNKKIRAADAKEVGVGNPAEETCCHPNYLNVTNMQRFVNPLFFIFYKNPLTML